jgi:hypothetical protein
MIYSMKKLFVSVAVAILAMFSAHAYEIPSASSGTVMVNPATGDLVMLESLQAQSDALLKLSQQLMTRSERLDPNETNSEYVAAMLRLASDIGMMANRIGEMANRIVYTEELIGVMADRIVTVSQALLGNNQATQTNILTAQRNFGEILSASHM